MWGAAHEAALGSGSHTFRSDKACACSKAFFSVHGVLEPVHASLQEQMVTFSGIFELGEATLVAGDQSWWEYL